MKKGLGMQLPRAQIGVSRWRRFRASIDIPLVLAVAAIATIGMLNLYSGDEAKFDRQVNWMIAGGVAFVVATVIDYRTLVRLAWPLTLLAIALLLIVALAGESGYAKGSYRWFDVGPFRIQPSEAAKLALIVAVARMLQDTEVAKYPPRDLAIRLAALGVPVVLVALQPDLGNAILMVLVMLSIGFLLARNVWPMVHATLVGVLAIPILWETMHKYQKNRILCFLDYEADPNGVCWHTRQSVLAVGSGRMWGKGWQEGTQNQFGYVPEHWTDFPYSQWAEEWGFVGSFFLIALYAFLTLWICNVAISARDRAGAAICTGVAAMTFWHVVVNIAMVLGVAPVVGVTLPLISYGGSSVITFFLGLGLVASVSLRKHGY